MGKQGAQKTDLCLNQRRDAFESRTFLGCEMMTKESVQKEKKKSDFSKVSLCMFFYPVGKCILF